MPDSSQWAADPPTPRDAAPTAPRDAAEIPVNLLSTDHVKNGYAS
jgi:hypothetical protein